MPAFSAAMADVVCSPAAAEAAVVLARQRDREAASSDGDEAVSPVIVGSLFYHRSLSFSLSFLSGLFLHFLVRNVYEDGRPY